jgi:transposase
LTTGRNAWLFAGSDDHAASAGHIFSLIASARLHKLAPKCWAETRARLDEGELANEIGVLTVPPPIGASEQSASR